MKILILTIFELFILLYLCYRVTDEVEALQAILIDDVKIKMVDGVPEVIETIVHPLTGDNTDQQFVCVTLEVKLTPGYPEKSPEVVLRNPRGLDDDVLDEITKQIKHKLDECLGQPVVFELIGVSLSLFSLGIYRFNNAE